MSTGASAIPTVRALKHYPDIAPRIRTPKRLRDDVLIEFVTPEQTVELPEPLASDWLKHSDTYLADALVLAELRNGLIVRDGSFVFTEQNELLRESVDRLSFIDALSKAHPNLEQELRATETERSPETVALLGAQRAANYYHWWTDVLAKYWLLQLSSYQVDQFVMAPVTHRFQAESLELLGLRPMSLSHPMQRFKRLIFVRGLSYGSSQDIVPEVLEFATWLRRRLRVRPPSPRPRKLFLSRRRAGVRRLLNEDEVVSALDSDFELVEPEALTVRQQATLFSEANVVVAPHGAGLTNLLFCASPTPVVELVHRDEPPNTYRRLAGLLGHPYIAIACDSSMTPGDKAGRRDITAAPSLVASAINRLRQVGDVAGHER
jgi:capsular polysaccharide biosynthesis protein